MTTFRYPPHPQPYHQRDVKEAFAAIADFARAKKSDILFSMGTGLEVWCRDKLFEQIFKVVFTNQKLYPKGGGGMLEGDMGRENPLPSLFIGAEKTQIRQIPLVDEPPWPFKFLLELGGMIVCRPKNRRKFVRELRQYLNNHPQYEIGIDAKEWPDGSIAVFTYMFNVLSKKEARSNVNVPERQRRSGIPD